MPRIPNAFLLEKDPINQASLHVKVTDQRQITPWEDYVKDAPFLGDIEEGDTPYGPMVRVPFGNEFFGRHTRDQGYITMTNIAGKNLKLGKVPFIDCIVIRQIRDGTLGRFMGQPEFRKYDKTLVHFYVDEDAHYQWMVERAKRDPEARVRDAHIIESRETHHKFVTEKQPMIPEELKQYEHLLIKTSDGSPKENAEKVLEYLKK